MPENQEDSNFWGKRASQFVAHINAKSSFQRKMKINKIHRKRTKKNSVSCLRQYLYLSAKKNIMSSQEYMFHILKTRCKSANVAEIDDEKINERNSTKTFRVDSGK